MLVFVLTVIIIACGIIGAIAAAVKQAITAPEQYREAKEELNKWKSKQAKTSKKKYYVKRR